MERKNLKLKMRPINNNCLRGERDVDSSRVIMAEIQRSFSGWTFKLAIVDGSGETPLIFREFSSLKQTLTEMKRIPFKAGPLKSVQITCHQDELEDMLDLNAG